MGRELYGSTMMARACPALIQYDSQAEQNETHGQPMANHTGTHPCTEKRQHALL